MTLKLKDKARILSKEEQRRIGALDHTTMISDIKKLLDYVNFLEEENARLRSSII